MRRKIIIGTRGSKLALWQANLVKQRIEKLGFHPVSLKTIKTKGDKILDSPLARIGDRGFFVKEIEQALTRKEIDLAVHSLKDIPTEIPAELVIGAVLPRDDPADALLSLKGTGLKKLPPGAVIGTSSLRRRAQLLNFRPDFHFVSLRGNVDTRVRKMREQNLDAIILSGAGLKRLGWDKQITERISTDILLPAVGQGVIAIEVHRADKELLEAIGQLNHLPTQQAVVAERALLRRLEGGCQVPLGALARVKNGQLRLEAVIASLDGRKLIRDYIEGEAVEAEKLGIKLAERLLEKGASEILREIRSSSVF